MSSKKTKTKKSYKAPSPPIGVIVHPVYAKCSTNILNRDSEENIQDVSRNGESQITRSLSTRSSLTTKLSNFIRRSDRGKTTLTTKKIKAADRPKHEKVSSELNQTPVSPSDQCLSGETTNYSEKKPPSSSRCEETCPKDANGNSNASSLIKDNLICQIEDGSESKRPYQRHVTPFKGLKYLPVAKFLKLLKPVPERGNSCPGIEVSDEVPVPQDQNIADLAQWTSDLDLAQKNSKAVCVNGIPKDISKSGDNVRVEKSESYLSSQNLTNSQSTQKHSETNTSDISTIEIFSGKSETDFDKNCLIHPDENTPSKDNKNLENRALSSVGGILELSEEEIKSTVVVVSENSQLFPKSVKSKLNQTKIKENEDITSLDITERYTEPKHNISLKLPNDSIEFQDTAKTSTSSEIPTKGLAVVFITTDDNTIRKIKKQTSAFAYGAQDENNIGCSIITVISDSKYAETNESPVLEKIEDESLKSERDFLISTRSVNGKNNSKLEVLQFTNDCEEGFHSKIQRVNNAIYTNARRNENSPNLSIENPQGINNKEAKNISLLQVSCCSNNQITSSDISTHCTLIQNGCLDHRELDDITNYNIDISQKDCQQEVPFLQNAQSSFETIHSPQNSLKHVDIDNGSLEEITYRATELQNRKDISTIEIVEYSNNSTYQPELRHIQFNNSRKNSISPTDFNNNCKDIKTTKVSSQFEEIKSLENKLHFDVNKENIKTSIVLKKDNKYHCKQEILQSCDQPQFQVINFKENFSDCHYADSDKFGNHQSSYSKVNYVNSVAIDDDLLDFGERLSCTTPSESLSGDINECYNVKLNAPEEFIVAGFHDFCHTMLSLEDSSLEPYDTGTIKKRPEKPTVKLEMQNSNSPTESTVNNELLVISDGEKSETCCNLSSESETVQKISTLDKLDDSMHHLLEEIQKSKIMEKVLNEGDAEVIEAIQVLDQSLMDSQEGLSDISSNFSNQPESPDFKRQNIILEVKSRSRILKDDKIQCDNLIEELMLEDSSKRVLNPPSITMKSNSLTKGIAVTISNCMGNNQTCSNSFPDFDKNEVHSDLNQNDATNEIDLPKEEFIEYEKDSHALGEMVCTFASQTGIECNFNSSSSSMETMSIASTMADDTKQNIGTSEAKEDTVSLPVSFTSEEHSPDALPSSPLQVSLNNSPMSHSSQDVVACHRTSPCSVDSGTSSHNQGYFVVVAIDFGTTYSGYAFSFTRDSDNIHMMKKWDGGDPGVFNQKTPTTLLLTPEGAFHSFGYSARDYYHDLDTEEAKRWLYFDKFKMALHHNEHLSLNTEIPAANGKQLLAVDVFAHALRYFKEHALQELSDQSATKILNEDVRWVVTVPAIWKQPAKQFMRAAAYNAGIASPEFSDQLLIALEPEAASIYCRRMRLHQLVPDESHIQKSSLRWSPDNKDNRDKNEFNDRDMPNVPILQNQHIDNSFNVGTRYMVVDCGGGTVDITVHEILDKHGTLKELQKATGGPYGSMGVDIEFEILLCDIFGADFIQQFKVKRPTGFVDLMVAFEARKRNASPYKSNPLNISLPFSFIDYFKKSKGSSVESAIKKSSHKDVKWSSQGMLRLEQSAMEKLFYQTVKQIREHIESIIFLPELNIDHLFLVGGFAESLILQKEIKDCFSAKLKVVIPQGVSLAILKGAVLFGLDPTIVNIRRLRMTYGVGVLNRFIHGVHPKEKLVIKDGIQWCADIFDKFVVTDQSVGLGDVVVRSYTPAKAGQSCSVIHIYCSERDNVYFITDPGVNRCGTLILDLSDSRYIESREIQTRMMFGDTEIKVTALDVTTGKCVKSEINFLSH